MDNNAFKNKRTVTIFRPYVHKLVYYSRDDITGRIVRKERVFPNREAFVKGFYEKS